jgi:hypothetical protein
MAKTTDTPDRPARVLETIKMTGQERSDAEWRFLRGLYRSRILHMQPDDTKDLWTDGN